MGRVRGIQPMRWAAAVPLIGGQLEGTRNATGFEPEEIASYPEAFGANDAFALERFPVARYVDLSKGEHISRGVKMVCSVCPCAGLSMFSMAKSDSESRADKNRWMFQTAESVLSETRPDVYFGENAPQLFTNMGRHVARDLAALGAKHSYSTSYYLTDASRHGHPQRRIRTFYFFWKDSVAPRLPIVERPRVTASELLASIPRGNEAPHIDIRGESLYRFLRGKYGDGWRNAGEPGPNGYTNAWKILEKLDLFDEFLAAHGGEKDDMVAAVKKMKAKGGGGVFIYPPSFDRDGCYPAIIKKTLPRLVHPNEDRYLTVREAAHLMGLPADYPIPGYDQYNAICQNVPVNAAEDATKIAMMWMDGKLERGDGPLGWRDSIRDWESFGDPKRPKQPKQSKSIASKPVSDVWD